MLIPHTHYILSWVMLRNLRGRVGQGWFYDHHLQAETLISLKSQSRTLGASGPSSPENTTFHDTVRGRQLLLVLPGSRCVLWNSGGWDPAEWSGPRVRAALLHCLLSPATWPGILFSKCLSSIKCPCFSSDASFLQVESPFVDCPCGSVCLR